MDNQFRNAAFGGFNRRDVADYLAQTAWTHAEQMGQLRTQLDEAVREQEELRAQLEAAREELSACQQELEQAQADRQTVREQAERLAELEQEREHLHARLAQLEPDAAAYATIKERTAGMELDAHRRAQAIVDQAKAEAQQQHRSVEQWLERLRSEYGEVCSQVESTMALATLELDRARVGLERVNQSLDGKKGALDGLTRTFDSQSHQ